MGLLLTFAPVLIQVAFGLMKWLSDKSEKNEQLRDLFVKTAQKYQQKGVQISVTRFENVKEQSDAGNAEWDRIEAELKATKEKENGTQTNT